MFDTKRRRVENNGIMSDGLENMTTDGPSKLNDIIITQEKDDPKNVKLTGSILQARQGL